MHSAITRSPSSGLPVCPAVHDALGRQLGHRSLEDVRLPCGDQHVRPGVHERLGDAFADPQLLPVITAALPSMRKLTDGTYRSWSSRINTRRVPSEAEAASTAGDGSRWPAERDQERRHPQCDAPAEQLLLRGGKGVVRRTVGVTEQALDAPILGRSRDHH